MNAQESLITLYFNVIIDFQDSQGSTNTDIQGNVSVKTSDRFFFSHVPVGYVLHV